MNDFQQMTIPHDILIKITGHTNTLVQHDNVDDQTH